MRNRPLEPECAGAGACGLRSEHGWLAEAHAAEGLLVAAVRCGCSGCCCHWHASSSGSTERDDVRTLLALLRCVFL
eukprot:363646-Chlamydomonas_euryale.AAC.6